jgi:ankyrin repeat protein
MTKKLILLFFLLSPFSIQALSLNIRPQQESNQRMRKQESNQASVAAFFESVEKGDVASVERLLAAGISANIKDENGRPALLLAIQTGRLQVVNALLAQGADVNTKYKIWTALGLAAHNGRLEIVSLLIAQGAKINLEAECHHTALILAAEGATLKAATSFMRPRVLLPETTGSDDDEFGAVSDFGNEHLEIVKSLIAGGADVNVASDCETGDWSATALVIAAIGGNVELVKILLAHGADPNRKTAASALWLLTHDNEMMREEINESDSVEEKLHKQALNDWMQSLKPAHAQIIELLKQSGARLESPSQQEDDVAPGI